MASSKNFFMEEKVKNHLKTLAVLALIITFSYQTKAAAPVKDWNLLVYVNGVNSLDSFGEMNINQMEEVGSNANMNIIVEWGSLARPAVQRLLIQKDNRPEVVTSPVLQSSTKSDMGDWRELVDFAKWANKNYPAKKTFLVVWNHGGGWHQIQDISWDERTGSKIKTEELGLAMSAIAKDLGHKIDIYGSDACLMGMVEVADQMASSVKYFVGSQDLEPGDGWPYTPFLRQWQANPTLPAREVSKLLSTEYLKSYNGGVFGNDSVTMSVFDMAYMTQFRRAMKNMSTELKGLSGSYRSALSTAGAKAKAFFYPDYHDLLDFVNIAEKSTGPLRSSSMFRQAYNKLVIANDQNQDASTHGLSIWFPNDGGTFDSYYKRYKNISFNKNTGWGEFLKALTGRAVLE